MRFGSEELRRAPIYQLALTILLVSCSPIMAQAQGQTIPQQRHSAPSQADRTNQYMKNVDRWSSEFGLDPSITQMMKQSYQQLPPSGVTPPRAAVDFARQVRQSAVKTGAPPGNFPVPVFRGKDTTYTVRPPLTYSGAGANVTLNTLVITTGDSARTVSSWYRASLAQAGWTVLDRKPITGEQAAHNPQLRQLPSGVPTQSRGLADFPALAAKAGISASEQIAAEKSGLQCTVQITESSRDRRTTANVSISRR